MSSKTLVAIILLIIVVFLIGWTSVHREVAIEDDPTGTYIAFVPTPTLSWRTVTLYLGADSARSAVMTDDHQDGKAVIVKRGSWAHEGDGNIGVALESDPRLLFSMENNALVLWDADPNEWGVEGLELMRAALPLASEWQWVETLLNDGTTTIPAIEDPFILRLEADHRLTVTGDCNDISGVFSLREGGKIVIGPLMSTKMFCEGSLETVFMDDLSSAISYVLQNDTLTFTLKDNEGLMRFIRYTGVAAQ